MAPHLSVALRLPIGDPEGKAPPRVPCGSSAPMAIPSLTKPRLLRAAAAATAEAESVIEDPDDADGRCDPGENYMDANHNGIWDEDGGNTGQGGAKDVVIIEVKVNYDRLFPAAGMIGYDDAVELVSDSVIANQPYGQQTQYAPPVSEECP